jgi:putative glycosyl hydrolase-like family 15 (GHL15) protein
MSSPRRPGSAVRGSLRKAGGITALLAGLIVVLAAVGTAYGLARTSPAAPARPARGVALTTFRTILDEASVQATTRAQWVTIARESTVVVLNSWDFRLIPVLKHANPRVQVWVYKDLSGVRSDDCTTRNGNCGDCAGAVTDSTLLSSGMGYCWVRRHHPDWLLKAAGTGQPLQFRGYPSNWETDYGSLAYQRQWVSNVLADVRAHGWDGVEVDNALTKADIYGVAARYPTNAAVQAATYSALRELGPAFTNAGLPTAFNVGYATEFPGLWQRWLAPVGGLIQEFYLSFSAQPTAVGLAAWSQYQDEVSSCAVQRKSCWFHAGSYSSAVTPRTRQYALASYLLADNSHQLLALADMKSGPDPRRLALGAPLGTMKQIGAAWGRFFTRGIAVVNPTDAAVTIYLGGSYLDNGHPVSVVTLRPAAGLVLRAAPQ